MTTSQSPTFFMVCPPTVKQRSVLFVSIIRLNRANSVGPGFRFFSSLANPTCLGKPGVVAFFPRPAAGHCHDFGHGRVDCQCLLVDTIFRPMDVYRSRRKKPGAYFRFIPLAATQ